MIALSGHTRVAFVGVGRLGGAAPLAVEGKALGSPRGDLEAGALRVTDPGAQRVTEPSTLRCIEPSTLRVTDPGAQRVTEHSRTGGSLSAESTIHSCTLQNALSQALIYSLTVYPPSTAPAPPLPHPLFSLSLRPSSPSHMLSFSLHTPPALSPPL